MTLASSLLRECSRKFSVLFRPEERLELQQINTNVTFVDFISDKRWSWRIKRWLHEFRWKPIIMAVHLLDLTAIQLSTTTDSKFKA